MKIYKKKSILLFVLGIVLVSCANKKADEDYDLDQEIYSHKKIVNEDYTVNDIDLKPLGIGTPSGIELINNKVYISDSDDFSIKVFDENLKKVDEISSEKIASPSLMTFDELGKQLFVIDSASSQIATINTNNNELTNVYSLPNKDSNSHYVDLSYNLGILYVTLNTPDSGDAKIVNVDTKTGDAQKLKNLFVGFSSVFKDRIYFINSLEYYRNSTEEGFHSGDSYVYELKDDELNKEGSLIEGSISGDFMVDDDFYYVYTSARSTIDRYDKNFKYVDTIASFDNSDIEAILKGNGSKILILMPNEGRLWEVKSKWIFLIPYW